MAPKKAAKPKAVVENPSAWVPAPLSDPFLLRDGPSTIVHTRTGNSDAARHKEPLSKGLNRITYHLKTTSSHVGYGMIIGLCDGAAWEQAPQNASNLIQSIFGKPEKRGVPPQWAAWGLCPSSGKLIRAHDVSKGHMQGAMVDKQLTPKPKSGTVEGMTIVVEANMSPLDPSSQEAATQRRGFSRTLHPLDMRGARYGQAARLPNTLAFSIDGGEFVEADVTLPDTVYPWVLLTWEGDAVTLVSYERLGTGDD